MSFLGSIGSALGGVIKSSVRAIAGSNPISGTALGIYDAYNTAKGRVGAFSPPQPTPVRSAPSIPGTGIVKTGGGVMPPGMAPPALPVLAGGTPTPPGTSIVPTAGSGQGQVFQTPDGQWHSKVWRGSQGHMTKATARIPSHWSNRRRPRMNPMNVHAARRAVRRIVSAEKLFRKIFSVTHPGHAGKVHIKRGKK